MIKYCYASGCPQKIVKGGSITSHCSSSNHTQTEVIPRRKTLKWNKEVDDDKDDEEVEKLQNVNYEDQPLRIQWKFTFLVLYFHIAALYGLYLAFTSVKWQTILCMFFFNTISTLGITAGVHRLWCHRTYKAKWPLRVFLSLAFASTFELNIVNWVRDHRVHHKYSDTVADPHNSKRGFFFSHIGWLFVEKHPECLKKLRAVDLSDLYADPAVRFHKKYYWTHVLMCCFVIPTVIPIYFWQESLVNAYHIAAILRLIICHHQSFLVNSVAHIWGNKPYDLNIRPTENIFIEIVAIGEGFHNYHHTFPYDYSTSEYGIKYNLTTAFIDLMAWIGLAYDRKVAPKSVIKARKLRTGEGSISLPHNSNSSDIK